MAGPVENRIINQLQTEFTPEHLEVTNESHMHSVPPGSETHFKVLVVSSRFEGMNRVARSRLVHESLKSELANGVHALSQRTLTPAEWQAGQASAFESPECRGGSKADRK